MPQAGTSQHPQLIEELRDYCDQLANIVEDADELVSPLTEAQFQWRPTRNKWSISECLAHLNVVNRTDQPMIVEAIERAKTDGILGNGPFRYGYLSRKFVRLTEPPVKIRMPAPKTYLPPIGEPKDKVLAEFLSIHARLIEIVRSANGIDLARVKVPTPISPRVRFSLGQCFALVTAHDRRHLWQAWRVRREPAFPT
jgi:hypothetical protein